MRRKTFGPAFSVANYTIKVRGEHGCTVTGTYAVALSQAHCYLDSRPAGTVDILYSEVCGHCRGSGRICKSKRTLTWKPCPVCNGNPETCPDTLLATVTDTRAVVAA
jgi:hypothetical protein